MGRPVVKTLEQVEAELRGDARPTGTREGPRELTVERGPSGMWCIRYLGGGELPEKLNGDWTNKWRAEQAISNYLATKAPDQPEAA